jgi:hypothetical protein
MANIGFAKRPGRPPGSGDAGKVVNMEYCPENDPYLPRKNVNMEYCPQRDARKNRPEVPEVLPVPAEMSNIFFASAAELSNIAS